MELFSQASANAVQEEQRHERERLTDLFITVVNLQLQLLQCMNPDLALGSLMSPIPTGATEEQLKELLLQKSTVLSALCAPWNEREQQQSRHRELHLVQSAQDFQHTEGAFRRPGKIAGKA